MSWLTTKTWAWTYTLEEQRLIAQDHRHYWTQAAACIGLAILRRWGC
jgi:hypothetical protein